VLVKKLGEGNCGKAIGRETPSFSGLQGADMDVEPAPAQQLCSLDLADIVVCAPGFEPQDNRRSVIFWHDDN